jgi:phosphatidylinositol alpha-1,6-mannosyltransferase
VSVLTYPSADSPLSPSKHYEVERYPSFDIHSMVKNPGSRASLLTGLPPKVVGMALDTARVVRRIPREQQNRLLWAVNWWPDALAAYLVSRICKIPYVITAHGYEAILPAHARRHFLYRRVMNGAARVFAVSAHTAHWLVQCKVSEERLRVIHNGVRLEQFMLDGETRRLVEQARKRFALDGRFVLLTISRLVPRKGHLAVLHALAGLKSRIPNLRYVIIGEGSTKGRLHQAVRELSLEDVVLFGGEVSDKERTSLLHACDVFVMPNLDILRPDGVLDTEGFGICFLEASACGKPAIAGKAGGAPEAVSDGQTGILVDPANTEELEDAIFKLYSDRDLALRLGLEGKQRVEREFTWDKQAEKCLNELTGILPPSMAKKGASNY